MPLGNTKDSFLDLKALADASHVEVPKNKQDFKNALDSEEWSPSEDDSTKLWWELGDDVEKYEHVFMAKKKKREPHRCTCFLAPWLFGKQDESEEEEEDLEEILSQSLSSNGQQGGIVKRSSIMVQVTPGVGDTKRSSFHPVEYHRDSSRALQKKTVRFTRPIGKVVDIQPFYLMTKAERRNYWWQQSDFDAFKLELSFLTNSKQLGGCEVWLGSVKNIKTTDPDKWWHKFGHSRRGLERYLSQEQQEVEDAKKVARLAVLKEQHRLCKHPNKEEEIAKMYKEYTAWSRNLALAAAASDADAVKCDFDDALRKTREYYLVKQAIMNGGSLNKHTPPFMVPVGLPLNKPPSAFREKKKPEKKVESSKPLSPPLSPTSKSNAMSKQAAGFGTGDENVGTMMSAINVATRC